jgi:hypothetical protein
MIAGPWPAPDSNILVCSSTAGQHWDEFIEELESRLSGEESMFRAQLLREDVGRLRRLG